jgi:hypothetical protein
MFAAANAALLSLRAALARGVVVGHILMLNPPPDWDNFTA